ncbi:MAG: nucleotidyltransferase domain-containing protein [Deltaproteobacteria bacterium]|nr:nucleotidyltransferase domain-containing protein [Deltaproteobacteria bacterium]
MLKELKNSIERFSLYRKNFRLVFLFGSFAKGCSTNRSDIDIAVVFEKTPDFFEVSALKDQLSGYLGREIDIVILNTASPIIKMQVLKYGVLIKKDKEAYSDFLIKTLNEYDDLKYTRKEIEQSILKGRTYA